MREEITGLQTEGYDAAQADLDRLTAVEVVRAVVAGHDQVLAAVDAAAPAIAELVERAAEHVAAGGRVVYAAAGSGAHIASVDASEWGPTFSFDGVSVLRAGAGSIPGSVVEAAAEDDARAGAADARALALLPTDVVVGISASGRTPYVLAAIEVAAAAGALTGAVTSEPGSPLARAVDCAVEVPVGAEVVAGSTRLKAGTAQKLVLNAFSTALMVRRGRTFGNLMAGMRVANGKLRERAVRVCELATGCTPDEARRALEAADAQVDVAIVVLARGATVDEARARLAAAGGAIRATLDNWS